MRLLKAVLWWINTAVLAVATAGVVGVISYVAVTWFIVAMKGEL